MNGIFCCISPMQLSIIQPVLEDLHWTKLWLVYNQTTLQLKNKKPIVNWLYFADISQGKYPIELKDQHALDEKILDDMSQTEVITLRMMDRLTFNAQLPYHRRRDLYLQHLRYWRHIILTNKIHYVVFGSVPHEIYDYVLYSLCDYFHIPKLIIQYTRINDRVVMMNDWQESAIELKSVYQQLEKKYRQQPIEKIPLPAAFEQVFVQQIATAEGISPYYMSLSFIMADKIRYIISVFNYLRINFSSIALRLINPIFVITKFVAILVNFLIRWRIKIWWQLHAVTANVNQKYIYLPLHYQPECTTAPMSGQYTDQRLIMDVLDQVLPSDVKIYVKEHPLQIKSNRGLAFYQYFMDRPRVTLINDQISSRELIKNCLLVATGTGTASWEALFLEKPVILFGHDIHQYCPGVFMVNTTQDAQEAVINILKRKIYPSLKSFKLFLAALEKVLFKGYSDENYQALSLLSATENIDLVSSAIKTRIKKDLALHG